MRIIKTTNLNILRISQNDSSNDESLEEPYNVNKMHIEDIGMENAYEKFRDTYEKSTGTYWNYNKFVNRASNWIFYGDEEGYVAVRPQKSGLLKLTGMAGSPKSIYKGFQALMEEDSPIWGAVDSRIADMASKVGLKALKGFGAGFVVKQLVKYIPSSVFGNAQIEDVSNDGGININYGDIGGTTKYFVANQQYIDWLLSQSQIPESVTNKIRSLI